MDPTAAASFDAVNQKEAVISVAPRGCPAMRHPPPGRITVEPGGPEPLPVGTKLTAVPGDWAATPEPTLSHVWERKPSEGEWGAIAGAIEQTYEAAPADTVSMLRVTVTGTNEAGTTSADAAETPTIVQPEVIPVDGGVEDPAGEPASPAEEPGHNPESDERSSSGRFGGRAPTRRSPSRPAGRPRRPVEPRHLPC